jgi:threonine dehydratase
MSSRCAEGAGAAALTALCKERGRLQGRRAAVILTGQNIDRAWMQTVLAGRTPDVLGATGRVHSGVAQ